MAEAIVTVKNWLQQGSFAPKALIWKSALSALLVNIYVYFLHKLSTLVPIVAMDQKIFDILHIVFFLIFEIVSYPLLHFSETSMVVEVLELAVSRRELERVSSKVEAALLERHERSRSEESLAGLI